MSFADFGSDGSGVHIGEHGRGGGRVGVHLEEHGVVVGGVGGIRVEFILMLGAFLGFHHWVQYLLGELFFTGLPTVKPGLHIAGP